jgi:hypothetical protein
MSLPATLERDMHFHELGNESKKGFEVNVFLQKTLTSKGVTQSVTEGIPNEDVGNEKTRVKKDLRIKFFFKKLYPQKE